MHKPLYLAKKMIIIYPLFLTFIKLTNGKAQMQVLYPAQVAAIGENY
jgi:hypothetical protein